MTKIAFSIQYSCMRIVRCDDPPLPGGNGEASNSVLSDILRMNGVERHVDDVRRWTENTW